MRVRRVESGAVEFSSTQLLAVQRGHAEIYRRSGLVISRE